MAYIIRIDKDSHTNGTLRMRIDDTSRNIEVLNKIGPCDSTMWSVIQRGYYDVHNEHVNGRFTWDPGEIRHKNNHQVIRGFRAECTFTEREEMLPSNSLKINGRLFRRNGYHSHTYRTIDPSTPHIGFELEFVCPGNAGIRITNDKIKQSFLDNIWCESDGSIGSYGIELISEPMTREQLTDWEESISELLKELDAAGCKSHDTTSCGLHFHTSVKPRKDYKEQYYKHLDYYQSNKEEYLKLARRTNSYHESTVNYNRLDTINTDRYCRISCRSNSSTPPRTFEWRFFKGTMLPSTFLKIAHRVMDAAEYAYSDDEVQIPFTLKKTYEHLPSRIRDAFPGRSDEERVIAAKAYIYTQTEDVVERMKAFMTAQAAQPRRRGRPSNRDVLAEAITNNNTIVEGGN